LKAYKKGADLERQVQGHMRLQGASLAQRSSGSHGPVDVTAFFPDHARLIQVTTKGQAVAPRLTALEDLRVAPNVTKEVWVRERASWTIFVSDPMTEEIVLTALSAAQAGSNSA
jgi:hypothetical protein